MAGWRQAIELALSEEGGDQVDCGDAVADGAGEPGRAGANAARLPGGRILFCGGQGHRGAPSDRSALRRTSLGLWRDGRA